MSAPSVGDLATAYASHQEHKLARGARASATSDQRDEWICEALRAVDELVVAASRLAWSDAEHDLRVKHPEAWLYLRSRNPHREENAL